MATAPIYCTHKELKRVFPQLDEFDAKTPIYGWVADSGVQSGLYIAYNSGLVSTLFVDGKSQFSGNQTIGSAISTNIDRGIGYGTSATSMDVNDGSALTVSTYIKIGDEILGITNISTNTLTVLRGQLGTGAAAILDDAAIYTHFQPSSNGDNLYDPDNDFSIIKAGSDPNDSLVEAGEDFTTLVTQSRTDASRYLDSKLDPNLPANQFKDKSGNFDYMIIRTTALLCATLMIRATDPTSEQASAMMEEAQGNIDALNNGKAGLSWQNTTDSSKGVVRDVVYKGTVRPVDTRGHYSGTFDLLKIKITTAGAIGDAKYSVWAKSGDKLGMNDGTQIVTDEIINGDYQSLSGGLQVRFSGTDFSSTTNIGDIWEVEVQGWSEEVDVNSLKPIRMTRRY